MIKVIFLSPDSSSRNVVMSLLRNSIYYNCGIVPSISCLIGQRISKFPLRMGRSMQTTSVIQSGREHDETVPKARKKGRNKFGGRGYGLSRCSVVGADAADAVVTLVSRDLQEGDVVMEMNPGQGLVTERLLQQTNANIVLFEKRENYNELLFEQFQSEIMSDKILLSSFEFCKFYKYYLSHQYNLNSTRNLNFLDNFPSQTSSKRSNVKVIGVVSDQSFFSTLSICFLLGVSFFTKVYPTFYLYIPDQYIETNFSTFPFFDHRAMKRSLVHNFFFNFSIIDTQVSRNFYPRVKDKQVSAFKNACTPAYRLVKIEPYWSFLEHVSNKYQNILHIFGSC